ncbi:unnamed protein product [Thelazia callipaeda]|uniref:RING-type E3 ubiquitin transferase n=1 Tax=Thelazia callipaeda TaxID=103827 RepID=A0A0N5D2V9_THECL|nr:unnamed protein product [Thelazia callipaeda]
MVSGRGDGQHTSRRSTLPLLTSYDKSRKPHVLRTGINTGTIHFDWISKELECGICEKTIQNTMVVRNCMHRFCADCILQRIHTGTRKCPLCHKLLPKKTPLKSDTNFDAIIKKFSLSAERRCVKRPITESGTLYFKNKAVYDNKSSNKRVANTTLITPSPFGEQTSSKRVQIPMKYIPVMSSNVNATLEAKQPLLPSTHSDTSDPPLTIDEGLSDDSYPNLQQPTTSSFSRDESKLNGNVSIAGSCEVTPVVWQKSCNYEKFNGMVIKSPQFNGSNVHVKCFPVSANLGISPHLANQAPITRATNGCFIHLNGNAKRTNNTKIGDGLHLPPSLENSISMEDKVVASPRTSEFLLITGKQRLYPGIESQLVLNPDASVVTDDSLPTAAKHLRYIVTCSATTVGHLCEYILQRIRIESFDEKDRKPSEDFFTRRVLLCPVKSDLALDDVLVVNETGEGQFTTMNVGERNSDSRSTSVFTINSPFVALDESVTVEQLKAEHWSNKKKPLKLIFKFQRKS